MNQTLALDVTQIKVRKIVVNHNFWLFFTKNFVVVGVVVGKTWKHTSLLPVAFPAARFTPNGGNSDAKGCSFYSGHSSFDSDGSSYNYGGKKQ